MVTVSGRPITDEEETFIVPLVYGLARSRMPVTSTRIDGQSGPAKKMS